MPKVSGQFIFIYTLSFLHS